MANPWARNDRDFLFNQRYLLSPRSRPIAFRDRLRAAIGRHDLLPLPRA
jgi:hypothetical protein